MTNVLVRGAYGQIARVATKLFFETTDAQITLYLHNAHRLSNAGHEDRVRNVDGDVTDKDTLGAAMIGQDVVCANLSGNLDKQARLIVETMQKAGIKRVIFMSSMGIYDEVPGQRYDSILDPYRNAVRAIEGSDLDYTMIRREWLSNEDEIDYGTTKKQPAICEPVCDRIT